MTNPRGGKSNAQKYDEISQMLDKVSEEYNGLKNKETKKATGLKDRIEKYENQLEELKPMKNLPYLSATCKKALRQKMIEIKYRRRKEIESKYTTKGKECEEAGITLYSLIKGKIFENNKDRFCNDYYTGEHDLPWFDKKKVMYRITDIKNSYNIHSFFDNVDTIKDANKWQGVGYMDLHETVKEYSIANVLVDNTEDAILLDLHRESYKWQDGDTPAWRELEIVKEHVYTIDKFEEFVHVRGCNPIDDNSRKVYESFVEMPQEERLIEHTFERDEKDIQAARDRIDDCRLYMEMIFGIKHVKAA